MPRKVLVTGSSGFLGSHVVDMLTEKGYDVVLYDVRPSQYKQAKNIEFIGDLFDMETLDEAVSGCDAIFHFAAQADIDSSSSNPSDTMMINVMGTQNLLSLAHKHGVKRFLFASTIYVYSELGSFYRVSKQCCEKMIEEYQREFALDYTILRYGSLYGPRANSFNFISRAIQQALSNKEIKRKGDGEEIREYIHVKDAASLTVSLLEEDYINKHVSVTGSQKIKVKELLHMLNEILGNNVSIKFEPADDLHHYKITPYNYKPNVSTKITPIEHIDLGQGLLELIYEYSEKSAENDSFKLVNKKS